MKIPSQQIDNHLKQHGLQACYLIHGDDRYTSEHTYQQISSFAAQQGQIEHVSLTMNTVSDWEQLETELYNRSLFCAFKLLKVHLPKVKLGEQGSGLLIAYVNNPNPNCCLLVLTPKQTPKDLQTRWLKQMDKFGVIINDSPLKPYQFSKWLQTELAHAKLNLTPDGIDCLTQLVGNNLGNALSAMQKLALLNAKTPIDATLVLEMVADSTQASIFDLVDSALAAKYQALSQTLSRLKAQNTEPLLVLWAITRQLRTLYQMAYACTQGKSIAKVMTSHRVWSQQKPLIEKALTTYPLTHWRQCIIDAEQLDVTIKTAHTSRIWDELLQLCLRFTGQALFNASYG